MSDARAMRRGALVVALPLVLLLGWQLLKPRDIVLGTNGAGSQGPVLAVAPGQPLCLQLVLAPGTERVRLQALGDATLTAQAGRQPARPAVVSPADGGQRNFDIPVSRVRGWQPQRVCVLTSGTLTFAGRPGRQPLRPAPTLGGVAQDARVNVTYLPRVGARRSLLSSFGDIADRAALFRPGLVGPWTFWLILLALPLLGGAALVALIRCAGDVGLAARRPWLVAALVAFCASATWALVEPALNAPDETDHVTYAQSLAFRGRPPDTRPSSRRPYSTELQAAFEQVQLAGQIAQRSGRPPFNPADDMLGRARHDDGGGYSTGAPYQPVGYAAYVVPQLVAAKASFWTRLTLMRLTSALLGALAAAAVVLLVLELLPRPRWPALLAGLLYALQPMVSFMAGVVSNDVAVTAASAATLALLTRTVQRGLTMRRAVGLAALLVAAPLAKGSGLFLWLPAALVLVTLWRRGDAAPRALAALAATVAALAVVWVGVSAAYDHPASPTTPARLSAVGKQFPPAPGDTLGSPTRALDHPVAYATWLWELFLPPAPGMEDLRPAESSHPGFVSYVEKAWASFGQAVVQFPTWVYAVILLAMLGCAAGALNALRRERRYARAHAAPLVILALAGLALCLAVEAVFFPVQPGASVVGAFGRYYLPVAPIAATIAAGATFAFGRARAPAIAGGLLTAMAGLWAASVLLALSAFYA